MLENKPFILNVYHSVSREQIETYLFQLTYDLLRGVVEEKAAGVKISEEEKRFIADFYKYGFVGVMLDWIKKGMKDDYKDMAEKMWPILPAGECGKLHPKFCRQIPARNKIIILSKREE